VSALQSPQKHEQKFVVHTPEPKVPNRRFGLSPVSEKQTSALRRVAGVPLEEGSARLPAAPKDMRAPSKVEQVYVVAALCTLSAIAFIVGDQPCCGEESLNPINSLLNTSSAGDTKKQMILLIMYSVGFLFMLRLRFRIFLFLGLPLLSLIIWCFVSAVWSVDPSLSFRRCIALGGTVGLGLYLGLQCSLEKFMSLMRWVVGIIILASFIVAAALPMAGLDYDGRLRGVFDHKNDLGDFAGLGFVLLAGRLLSYEYKRRLGFAVDALLAALCIVALVLAQSASPIPALIVSMAVLALAHGARVAAGQITAFMPIITAATAGGILMLGQNIDFLSKLLDRSSDLSGRVRVWAFSIKMVMERPLEGYGYGAFWTGGGSPAAVFWRSTHLAVPHAHNGYLQLMLDAGLIGLALLALAIVMTALRLCLSLRYCHDTPIPWSLSYIGFVLATQVAEPGIWSGNSLATVLIVFVVVEANILTARNRQQYRTLPQIFPRNALRQQGQTLLRPSLLALRHGRGLR
jgi:exopolysaccharide production protein ExoQ